MRIKRKMKNNIGWLFIIPSLTGTAVFYLLPFADVVRRSFMQAVGNGFAGLNNYRQVLLNDAFRLAAGNTLKFVMVCIPMLLALSLWIAVMLQGQAKVRNLFKSAYLIPLAIPAASVVLLWNIAFDNGGILNGILAFFNIKGNDWMNTDAAFWVLVFSYIWKNLGYDVVLWTAGLQGIPESIYEAAGVDGAGGIRMFFYITLPNLRPAAFINSFMVFREAYLVSGNYPQEKIYLLQHVFNNWFLELSVDKMSAGSVLICMVLIVFVLLLQKSWDRD